MDWGRVVGTRGSGGGWGWRYSKRVGFGGGIDWTKAASFLSWGSIFWSADEFCFRWEVPIEILLRTKAYLWGCCQLWVVVLWSFSDSSSSFGIFWIVIKSFTSLLLSPNCWLSNSRGHSFTRKGQKKNSVLLPLFCKRKVNHFWEAKIKDGNREE